MHAREKSGSVRKIFRFGLITVEVMLYSSLSSRDNHAAIYRCTANQHPFFRLVKTTEYLWLFSIISPSLSGFPSWSRGHQGRMWMEKARETLQFRTLLTFPSSSFMIYGRGLGSSLSCSKWGSLSFLLSRTKNEAEKSTHCTAKMDVRLRTKETSHFNVWMSLPFHSHNDSARTPFSCHVPMTC